MQTTIKVDGMTCKNCEKAVKDALLTVAGVREVAVNLADGSVVIEHEESVNAEQFKEVVEDQGYDVA